MGRPSGLRWCRTNCQPRRARSGTSSSRAGSSPSSPTDRRRRPVRLRALDRGVPGVPHLVGRDGGSGAVRGADPRQRDPPAASGGRRDRGDAAHQKGPCRVLAKEEPRRCLPPGSRGSDYPPHARSVEQVRPDPRMTKPSSCPSSGRIDATADVGDRDTVLAADGARLPVWRPVSAPAAISQNAPLAPRERAAPGRRSPGRSPRPAQAERRAAPAQQPEHGTSRGWLTSAPVQGEAPGTGPGPGNIVPDTCFFPPVLSSRNAYGATVR